ncbi:MAG: methyltransferase domain-containing protein [Candidatus Paceibacterota bacterium]
MKYKIKRLIRNFICSRKNSESSNIKKLPPLDITPVLNYANLKTKDDINNWIKDGINCFREWYQPVDFGDNIIANVTRPPNWDSAPEYNDERGVGKWNFIISKNLPPLVGKRVLDLGCNNGVISLMIAREGAKEVIGIDRNENIHQKTYQELPEQNIIAQANFVKKSFELKEDCKFPVEYIASDISNIESLNLGKFDIIVALCVIYHEMEGMPKILSTLAGMTDHLVLQTSLTHGGELAKWADLYNHVKLMHQAGFSKIKIDAPIGYHLPMIIGEK